MHFKILKMIIKGALLLRGKGGEGRRGGKKGDSMEGTGEESTGRDGRGKERRESEGRRRDRPPFRKFLDPPLLHNLKRSLQKASK